MSDNESNRTSLLDEAIATCRRNGYYVERAEVFRRRENRLQAAISESRAQNHRGGWVPAIPEPLLLMFGRTRCKCGETRRGRLSYREHYALAHVLALADDREGGEQ